MNRRQERSPIFSTLLLVAVAGFLTAVLGVAVFGIGDTQTGPPDASFDFGQTDGTYASPDGETDLTLVTVTYEGEPTLSATQLRLSVEGERAYGVEGRATKRVQSDSVEPLYDDGRVSPKTTVTVAFATEESIDPREVAVNRTPVARDRPSVSRLRLKPGDTVQVVYDSRRDESYVLDTYEVAGE